MKTKKYQQPQEEDSEIIVLNEEEKEKRGEIQLLLNKKSQEEEPIPIAIKISKGVVNVLYLVPTANAVLIGMMQVYIPVSLLPLLGIVPSGLWLLAPVGFGGAMGLSEEILKYCQNRFPENNKFKFLGKVSKIINHGLLGFLQDFGFTWTTLILMAGPIKPQDTTNIFAKIIAPSASVIPAALLRYFRYSDFARITNNRAITTLAYASWGGMCPTFLLKELVLQDVVSEDSYIPIMVILGCSLFGGAAGMLRKNYLFWTMSLIFLLEFFAANPSLATAAFSFLNDWRALNSFKVPNGFFYGNLGVQGGYLMMLGALSLITYITSYKKLKQRVEEYHPKNIDKFHRLGDSESDEEIDPEEVLASTGDSEPDNENDSYEVLASSEKSSTNSFATKTEDEVIVARDAHDSKACEKQERSGFWRLFSAVPARLTRKDSLIVSLYPDPEEREREDSLIVRLYPDPEEREVVDGFLSMRIKPSSYTPQFFSSDSQATPRSLARQSEIQVMDEDFFLEYK